LFLLLFRWNEETLSVSRLSGCAAPASRPPERVNFSGSNRVSQISKRMAAACRRNQVLDWERAKDVLQVTHQMIAALKEQLGEMTFVKTILAQFAEPVFSTLQKLPFLIQNRASPLLSFNCHMIT
jgi:hypothetical protein